MKTEIGAADVMAVRVSQTSPGGTTVPPAAQIVDADGVVWSLSPETEHGGNLVLRDGIKFVGAGARLLWTEGKVYLQNMPGAWFVVVGTSWAQTSAPVKE